MGSPADWPRAVSVMSRRGLRGGVFEEELVEVPHAVEEQHVGVLRLDAQVLLHDGECSRCMTRQASRTMP